MKNTLFCVLLLMCFSTVAYAQLPTVEELVTAVEQNYQSIQSLDIQYSTDLYVPSVGLEPPDSFAYSLSLPRILYAYPDTMTLIRSDTTETDTTYYVHINYKKKAGNAEYERIVYYLSTPDTVINVDTGFRYLNDVEERIWFSAYTAAFPARLFFRFRDYLNTCPYSWVSGNPEPNIYIISTNYITYKPGREPYFRQDFYIDNSNGTIIKIQYYDSGIDDQRQPDNLMFEGEDVYSDFQQINGIWLPHHRTEHYFGNPAGDPLQLTFRTERTEYSYTFQLIP